MHTFQITESRLAISLAAREVLVPVFLEDLDKSVGWLKDNLAEMGKHGLWDILEDFFHRIHLEVEG
jgi:hypothetical protein